MIAKVRKIGNSAGVILSKSVLEQCGIKDEVDIQVKNNTIIIVPVAQARQGWEEQFLKAGAIKDQDLIGGEAENDFDRAEWTW